MHPLSLPLQDPGKLLRAPLSVEQSVRNPAGILPSLFQKKRTPRREWDLRNASAEWESVQDWQQALNYIEMLWGD